MCIRDRNDAKAFAAWIAKQGFEVKAFTDEKEPVTFAGIFTEVERIISAASCDTGSVVLRFRVPRLLWSVWGADREGREDQGSAVALLSLIHI